MVMRCTRLSRYSAVISSADSRRSPRSIFAIIARSSLMRGLLPSVYRLPLLDHAHGFALGARERARRHQRHLGREPDGPGQALADPPAQVDEHRMRRVEAPAAADPR